MPYSTNQRWAKPGPYTTKLSPEEEAEFQSYIQDQSDDKDLGRHDAPDYDMRGWWQAMKAGDPRAEMIISENDGLKHRKDVWKTPYHQSFSRESIYATDGAPSWNTKDQLVLPNGSVVFDERNKTRGIIPRP